MRKCLIFCLVLLLLITTGLAYSVPDDTIVYVTTSGEKYHRENCSYLKSSRSMTIAQAEASGYTPCSRCSPDVLLGEYESDWDGEPGESSVHSTPRPTVKPTPEPSPTATTEQSGMDAGAYVALAFIVLLFGVPLVTAIFEAIRTVVWSVKEYRREKKRKK